MSPEKGKEGREDEGSHPAGAGGRTSDGRLSLSMIHGASFLRVFSAERQTMGIAEMAELVGLTRSTSHRYASTLVQLGYLRQGDKRRYMLAPGAADPGIQVIRQIRRGIPAQAALQELRGEVGYTVSMGVLHDDRVIYIHRLFGHRRGQHAVDRELREGAHIPLHCTALGKVLLASVSERERRACVTSDAGTITDPDGLLVQLDRINLRAPLVSDEEFVAGARSIAMFVPRPPGDPHIAIDVTVPASAYTTPQLLKRVGPAVKRAAIAISEARSQWPHSD